MTVMAERTVQMSVEEFEKIAEVLERESDAVRFEFFDGRIGVKGMTDGDHSEIVRWLQARCMQVRADMWLYGGGELGLKIETYRQGRAKPDAVLAPPKYFAGQGDWANPDRVLMTVEVTSYDSDTNRRDRKEKPAAYADTGIPVYLLIDRDDCTVTVHSDPAPGGYRAVCTVKLGAKVTLPDPVGIELDTEELKDFIR
ncbi:Uma2 family endonuclease [Streptomyces sp. ISL-96]|uniref:Uma2 family endonuclease n=1 Tax=Streptomyces sp. ISL-96 TaxID=2819191 RepID=UPI001BE86718|nr:Uma2 family endonuclease [Streptomyces sp. ISL-96]MBT2487913.1 Uma2 family endonuclease [Streptomyces sp. ISL-96]